LLDYASKYEEHWDDDEYDEARIKMLDSLLFHRSFLGLLRYWSCAGSIGLIVVSMIGVSFGPNIELIDK